MRTGYIRKEKTYVFVVRWQQQYCNYSEAVSSAVFLVLSVQCWDSLVSFSLSECHQSSSLYLSKYHLIFFPKKESFNVFVLKLSKYFWQKTEDILLPFFIFISISWTNYISLLDSVYLKRVQLSWNIGSIPFCQKYYPR